MPFFKKKPVVIEAVQFLATKESFDEIVAMGCKTWKPGPMGSESFFIYTKEGDMIASKGDWIIKEPFDKERGFYPCKPDIFEQTYEPETTLTLEQAKIIYPKQILDPTSD